MITKRRLVKILIVLAIFMGIYFRYFRYVDFANGCNISLKLSFLEFSNRNIMDALTTLRYGSPQDYAMVCANVSRIVPNIGCGGFHGGCFYGSKGEIYISTSQNDFIGWTSAIIVHEACHAKQHNDKQQMSEQECYEMDHKVLGELVQFIDYSSI
jgi:hypothetical protein